jgi:hypothetical protein
VDAKKWRRLVANAATRPPKEIMRTLSFPLDLALGFDDFFEDADQLYNTVEGLGKGSLAHVLMRAHLCGLGLHPSTGAAHAARIASHFPNQAFVKALEDGLGIVNVPLTPQSLYVCFSSLPRPDRPLTVEDLADRIRSKCLDKKISDKTDDNIRELMMTLAQAACTQSSSYKHLKEHAWGALAACGAALQKQSSLFPSLALTPVSDELGIVLSFSGQVDSVLEGEPEQYWLHHIIACLLRHTKPENVDTSLLTDKQVSGLSQLFGKLICSATGAPGLLLKTTAQDLSAALDIPASRLPDVALLIDAAKALPKPALFDENNYGRYRTVLGSKWRSWISGYLTRLAKLEEQTQNLGAVVWPVAHPPGLERILSGLDLDEVQLQQLDAVRVEALGLAKVCLAVLTGKSMAMRPIAAAQALVIQLQTIEDAHATFRSVLNQLDQLKQDQSDEGLSKDLKAWLDCLAVSKSDIFVLPNISGGSPDVASDLNDLNQLQQSLFRGMDRLLTLIDQRAKGGLAEALAARQAQEKQRAPAARAKSLTEDQYKELAQRRFIQGLLQLSKRLSPLNKQVVMDWLGPLVINSKVPNAKALLNKVLFNHMGSFYRSPWSPARHEPLPVCWDTFQQMQWMDLIVGLKDTVRVQLQSAPNAALLQDLLEIMRFWGQLKIDTLDGLGAEPIKAILDASGMKVHLRLKLTLQKQTLAPSDVANVLTAFASQLAKLRFQARRENFIVRHKFSRKNAEGLMLVPKDKPWKMPDKYLKANGPMGKLLQENPDWVSEPQEAKALFKKVAGGQMGPGPKALLAQLPHDWYVEHGFRKEAGHAIEGLDVGKNIAKKLKSTRGAKLIGPSNYFGEINKTLTGGVIGKEWTLILDWVFENKLSFVGGVPVLQAKPLRCEPRLAVPFAQTEPPKGSIGLFDHMVAIDLGEQEIGFAVFSVNDILQTGKANPIIDPLTNRPANGAISIAGVGVLINDVKGYRANQSTNSKLSQNFNTRLEKLRDSVGSEVVQKIEALCARFNAFPVLESSVVNFQTGSRQLDLVYGDVVRHFVMLDVTKAHIDARKAHWMGGETWKHPYLMSWPFDKVTGKPSKTSTALNLFPGVGVSPAGTSQTCTHCGRNGLRLLRDLGEKIKVLDGGVVELPEGQMRLMSGWDYSEMVFKRARRDKQNLAMNRPLAAGQYNQQTIYRFAKQTNRQKAFDMRSSGSSQSRFQCLFADCMATYHADAGAAINIGRKFIADKIDAAGSRQKLLELT